MSNISHETEHVVEPCSIKLLDGIENALSIGSSSHVKDIHIKFQETLNYSYRSHKNREYQLECFLLEIMERMGTGYTRENVMNSVKIADPFRSVTEKLVSLYPDTVQYLSDRWKSDRQLMVLAMKKDTSQFQYMLPEFKQDRELVLIAIKNPERSLLEVYNADEILTTILPTFAEDFEIVRECCLKKPYGYYPYLSEKLRDNDEIVMLCFSQCRNTMFDFLPERFKNDRLFVWKTVEINPEIVLHCGKDIVDDELMLKAVKFGLSLDHLYHSPLLTRELALEYAKTNSWRHIPDHFKNDKEVCMQIVLNDDRSLEFLSEEMRQDIDVITVAFKTFPRVFSFQTEQVQRKLLEKREIIMDIIDNHSYYHYWELFQKYMDDDIEFYASAYNRYQGVRVPPTIMTNREFILKCLHNNVPNLRIDPTLHKDPEIVRAYWKTINKPGYYHTWNWKILLQDLPVLLEAIEQFNPENALGQFHDEDGMCVDLLHFGQLPAEILSNREITLTAAKKKLLHNVSILSDELKNDKEIVMSMLQNNPSCLHDTPLNQDPEFILQVLKDFPYIDVSIVSDYAATDAHGDEFLEKAIELNGMLLNTAPSHMRSNKEIVMKAVTSRGLSLEFADDLLKQDFDIVKKAVQQCGYSLEFASDELKSDRILKMEAIQSGYLPNIQESEWNDPEMLLSLSKGRQYIYQDFVLPDEISNNWKLFEQILSNNGDLLWMASDEIRNDENMVLLAVKSSSWECLQNASQERQEDLLTILRARQVASRCFSNIEMEGDDWAPYSPEIDSLTHNVWFYQLSTEFEVRRSKQYQLDREAQKNKPKFDQDY